MESNSETELRMKEFATKVFPTITNRTRFEMVSEGQGTVSYTLRSGKVFKASLTWYSIPGGHSLFAHYDEDNDVCYIGKFVE
jgi:hypothetical protein